MTTYRWCWLALLLVGCDGGDPPPGETPRNDAGGPPPRVDAGEAPPLEGDECENGGVRRTLPGSGSDYCLRAHPSCTNPDASCALYITLNTGGAYFGRLDDSDVEPFVTVESYQAFDGDDVKDPLAELPRILPDEVPGIDPERIYLIGWSAGAGAVFRGMCQRAKRYDESPYGTTSDIYAAIATLGGCPACSEGFEPISGHWHVFATNGRDDMFGGDGCYERLSTLARTNGCANPEASWCAVASGDALVPSAPGDERVERVSFGSCARGDVEGYRFADEAHVVRYRTHVDSVRAYDLVWDWLQGRRKPVGSGVVGAAGMCR